MQIPTQILAVGGAKVQLYDDTLGSAQASFDVQNISQTYNHLHMRLVCRSDAATTIDVVAAQFNGDTGNNYDYNLLSNVDTTVSGVTGMGSLVLVVGDTTAANSTAGNAGYITIDVMDYKGTTFNKGVVCSSVMFEDTLAAGSHGDRAAGQWRSTAAINRITIILDSGNFAAGSRLTIYGLL